MPALKPYPSYRDSGVAWLGEVPGHWEVRPVGGMGSLFKGNGGSKGDEVPAGIPCVRYGDLYTQHEFFITRSKAYVSKERSGAYTPIRYGDVLFAASGETDEDIGRSSVNLIDGEARCGGDVLVLRPEIPAMPRYLGYAADSSASRNQKACMGRGFTVVHIYGSQLKRLLLPLPPLPEQSSIVRYLDYMDRRIQRYIRAKQKLIKLLEEQKQAIIHQAVTGQIDVRTGKPYPAYKPSGVEWLGDVPEHWDVMPLKRIGTVRIGLTYSPGDICGEDGTLVLRASNVSDGRAVHADDVRVSKEVPTALRVREGDILLCVRSGSRNLVGKAAIITKEFEGASYGAFMCLLRSVDNRFYFRVLNSNLLPTVMAQFETSTINQLTQNDLRSLQLPVPPDTERVSIADFLDITTSKADEAIASASTEVKLLREYRTRLISDVVTGKLDVREAAVNLPEELEEEPEEDQEQEDELDEDLEDEQQEEDEVEE